MDLRMRKGRRADLPIIWPATLQTAWDDLPEDERKGLDRQAWESHFRKKIEQYVEGNRTERWVAEGPSGEFLGYIIIGESGFLTPEVHAFLYDIWVAPDHRGKGIGQALVDWAGDWAPEARAPEDQARGRRGERTGAACVREARIHRGAAVHGEAPPVGFWLRLESRKPPPKRYITGYCLRRCGERNDPSQPDRDRRKQGQGAHPEERPGHGQAPRDAGGHVPPDVRRRRWLLRIPVRPGSRPVDPRRR